MTISRRIWGAFSGIIRATYPPGIITSHITLRPIKRYYYLSYYITTSRTIFRPYLRYHDPLYDIPNHHTTLKSIERYYYLPRDISVHWKTLFPHDRSSNNTAHRTHYYFGDDINLYYFLAKCDVSKFLTDFQTGISNYKKCKWVVEDWLRNVGNPSGNPFTCWKFWAAK